MNYVFVGDEAFTLRPNFLKPFSHKDLTPELRIFNYRISIARRFVENVFGILANRFCVYKTDINLNVDTIDKVVRATCVLHNFLRRKSNQYNCSGALDVESCDLGYSTDTQRDLQELQVSTNAGHQSNIAKRVRNTFVDYFNNEGSVSWQNHRCGLNE